MKLELEEWEIDLIIDSLATEEDQRNDLEKVMEALSQVKQGVVLEITVK